MTGMRVNSYKLNLVMSGVFAFGCFMGCHDDMRDQPRYDTFEQSDFFDNGMSARPYVAGTVARGAIVQDTGFASGKLDGQLTEELPVTLDRELLVRGQQRFNIFCAPCHAPTGNGDGMIVQRGFRRPPSFHSERLRTVPIGHFVDVMSHGFGVMPKYNAQIDPRDRWAIAAYVRALQLSQNATLDDVPAADRSRLGRQL